MTSESLHAWQHLFSAVLALTCQSGTIQERLAEAYLSNLCHLADDSEIPEPIRRELDELCREFAASATEKNYYSARESIQRLDKEQARRFAAAIVSLYDRVVRDAA